MAKFSVGTKAKEKRKVQGIKATGKFVKVKKASWGKTIYNIRFPNKKGVFEYHIGELKKVN